MDQRTGGDDIENRPFDELAVGDAAELSRQVTRDDAELLVLAAGEAGLGVPATTPAAGGALSADQPGEALAQSLVAAALFARLVATRLPGPGATLVDQQITHLAPIRIGDRLTARLSVAERLPATGEVVLDGLCRTDGGTTVATARLRVRAPASKIRQHRLERPDVRLGRHERFHALLARAAGGPPMDAAIAHPCDAQAIGAAVEAAEAGLIRPILVGPRPKIERAARAAGVGITPFRLVDAPHSEAAAKEAVALVRRGEAQLLMKGSLHTDELLHAVLDPAGGLRTARRLSHIYLMDVPGYPRPLLVTDAAVNIAPALADKRDIVQNAIDLAHVMGLGRPRVAILSAVETVNAKLPSTLDAAALCKMADRGQITGGDVDGPLAFDNAVSPAAAAEKGIVSDVAGRADILVVPDLEAGNMLAKQLTFLGGADAAGIVMGARVPVILTSRADAERTRLASCAVAVLVARSRAEPAALPDHPADGRAPAAAPSR